MASACDAVLPSSPTPDLTWSSSYVMSLPVGQLSVPVPPWGTTGCGAFGKDVCHRTYQDPQTHIPDMYMHKRAANPVPFWKVSKGKDFPGGPMVQDFMKGARFNPSVRKQEPTCHTVWPKR